MQRESTVAASVICAFVDFAMSRGADRRTLLARSAIDPASLANRDNRVPFSAYKTLIRTAQGLCADPAIALHFGESVDCTEIMLPLAAPANIEEAMVLGNRYAPLTVDVDSAGSGDRFGLCRHAGQLWMVDRRANPNDFPELTESAFARMVCTTRRLMPNVAIFRAVHVTHPACSYRDEYERIFRVPVTFASDKNALQLDEAAVARARYPSPSKYVAGVLQNHADALLRKMDDSRSMRGRVEDLIRPVLHTETVTIDKVARRLGLSRQTLFRKLNAEGVTFQQVLDELRRSLAMHYLVSDKRSIQQTARLVGFSDSTAFSRAFKRWTGFPPSDCIARRPPLAPTARE